MNDVAKSDTLAIQVAKRLIVEFGRAVRSGIRQHNLTVTAEKKLKPKDIFGNALCQIFAAEDLSEFSDAKPQFSNALFICATQPQSEIYGELGSLVAKIKSRAIEVYSELRWGKAALIEIKNDAQIPASARAK